MNIETYKAYIESLKEQDLTRTLKEFKYLKDGYVSYQGKRMLNLSSSDYLGIASNKNLYAGFLSDFSNEGPHPMAASASRLLTGNHNHYQELESLLSKNYNKSTLLFNSGYHANIGILKALTTKEDLILSDKLVHASLIDGIQLSTATHLRFKHNDMNHLEKLLLRNRDKYKQVFIVTESVYSMDGDIAPIEDIIKLKEKYDAFFYLDEAHAVGVFGNSGFGVAESLDLIDKVDLLIGTFGKAIASVGAFVATNKTFKLVLINKMRSLIYTTGLPPVNIAWTKYVWERLPSFQNKRDLLLEQANSLRIAIQSAGLTTLGSSCIVPIIIGDNKNAVNAAKLMREKGYLSFPIRQPTVPAGTARLRLSLTPSFQKEDIASVIKILEV